MSYRPSRREFAAAGVAGLSGLSGCLDWVPGINDDRDPAREEMTERAASAENELIEDGSLVEYQNQDHRIIADTYDINVRPIDSVGIGEATEYRATGEIDLGENIDDLPNYVVVDRDTLIGKLQEPAYDMFEPVIRSLERYREEERNVHQSRISEYGTMFHGRGETYVLHYVNSNEIEDFDNREDYEEDFEENASVWNGEEWT